MKILFANATRTWGGVKTWTLNLVRAFAESGISSIVCCRRTDPLLARCAEAGALVEPFTFGMDYNPLAMIRAHRILKKHRPSCIVTNISKELRIFGPIARALGIPVVARLGFSTDLRNNTRTRLEYRNLVRAILVPSHAIARDLPREIIGATPIQVVHNGVVVSNRTSWDSDARPVRTVFLGKLIERKGIAAILEAVPSLFVRASPWRLRLSVMARRPMSCTNAMVQCLESHSQDIALCHGQTCCRPILACVILRTRGFPTPCSNTWPL